MTSDVSLYQVCCFVPLTIRAAQIFFLAVKKPTANTSSPRMQIIGVNEGASDVRSTFQAYK